MGAGLNIVKADIRKSFILPDGYSVFQAGILKVLRAAKEIAGSTIPIGVQISSNVNGQAALKFITNHQVSSRVGNECTLTKKNIEVTELALAELRGCNDPI